MAGLGKSNCWNCSSPEYYNTVSTEHCPSCGIRFEYHGSGANEKYQAALDARYWAEKNRQQEEFEEYYKEHYG